MRVLTNGRSPPRAAPLQPGSWVNPAAAVLKTRLALASLDPPTLVQRPGVSVFQLPNKAEPRVGR